MADLDGDGNDDIVTGSYWPGDLYFIRGLARGKFAAPEILKGADGKNLSAGPPWKSENDAEHDALAAVPCLVDFDGDGDLDLLVGNIAGRVIHIPNVGTAKKYSFDGSKRRALEAGGEELKVEGDSGPVAADWDGDGKFDLVVGAGDGSVAWFRNTGTKTAPSFAKGGDLLAKSTYESVAHDQAPTRPGYRTKVWVADWNGDGRMDLLVGDYWDQRGKPLTLSKEQIERRDALRKKREELSEKYSELYQKLGKKAEGDPEFKKVSEEYSRNADELSKLEEESFSHGSVWLYLRQPPAR